MRRAYVDAVAIVVFTVLGSVTANAYTQSVIEAEAEQVCRVLVDSPECPD
jgi:hypothetical protein